jgi:glucose/arabinose dehydrogenase
MKRTITLPILGAALALQAQNPVELQLNNWATGLTEPVDIAHCGDSRLFVVLQPGVIRIITDSMTVLPTPFLNIQSIVNDAGNEQGLLGLAFDPAYASNGYFYVHYTGGSGNGFSVVSRFTVSADSNIADVNSQVVLFTWPQPFANHNGGDLEFGPDGNLYIALGDGGSAGDPQGNAQDLTDPLGDILRIRPEPDSTYSIPADNPWVNAGGDTLPEIWASGLRNPFRFGFDALTGDVWIGDVGQNAWEEIDLWPGGTVGAPNFGWRCYEGIAPYNTSGCQPQNVYVPPVTVHENVFTGGDWCSSIGGRVYRGTQFPRLQGRYIYTDYCAAEFWSLTPDGLGVWNDELLLDGAGQGWVCIAEGNDGSLYTCNQLTGVVRKIVDRCPMDPPAITNDGTSLTSTTADGYQWFLNGTLVTGATGQSFTPTLSGDYHVVGSFANGCELSSDTIAFAITGLADLGLQDMRVFPVPANEVLLIEHDGASQGAALVRMLDPAGRVVLEERWPAGMSRTGVEVHQLSPGSYLIQVLDSRGARMGKARAVVQR